MQAREAKEALYRSMHARRELLMWETEEASMKSWRVLVGWREGSRRVVESVSRVVVRWVEVVSRAWRRV